jgi:hypothetical protein
MAKTARQWLELNGRLGNASRKLIRACGRIIVAYATSTVTTA